MLDFAWQQISILRSVHKLFAELSEAKNQALEFEVFYFLFACVVCPRQNINVQ